MHKRHEAIIELFYINFISLLDISAKLRLQVCKIYEKDIKNLCRSFIKDMQAQEHGEIIHKRTVGSVDKLYIRLPFPFKLFAYKATSAGKFNKSKR